MDTFNLVAAVIFSLFAIAALAERVYAASVSYKRWKASKASE